MFVVTNLTKLYYHEPRPFWVGPDVEAWHCSTQYGNPSGHAFMSMSMAMTLWLDANHVWTTSPDYTDSLHSIIYTRLAYLLVALTFTVTVGFSRVIIGVHSWN